jgi:hypothetical protein
MFWLLETAKAAGHAEKAETVHHTPVIVELVNHYLGPAAHRFQMNYTYPRWKWLLGKFDTTPEAAFGPYSPETAIPWYTVMFVIACILSVVIIWILKGKLSEEEPGHGQQTLELGVLAIRGMIEDIIGPQGLKYFPVVATPRAEILSGCGYICSAYSGRKPHGFVPAVYVANRSHQRNLCAGDQLISLLQLCRHQGKWRI